MFLDNAVLKREMLTSLRTRKAFVLQAAFLAVLSGAILLGWPGEEVMSTSDQATRSTIIFKYFMMGAVLMVSMLAPAFSASGNSTVRFEFRIDKADFNAFTDSDGNPTDTQKTFAAQVYTTF